MRQYSMGFLLGNNQSTISSLPSMALTIPIVMCKYVWLLFVPWNLTIYHATPMVINPLDLRFILPAIFLAALIVALRGLWRSTSARFALLWFLIMLLPVFNLRAFDPNFMVQERYLYLPSIGFCLLIAMALGKVSLEGLLPLRSRKTAQLAVVVIVGLLLGGKTFAQNEVWKDDMTLYGHGVQVAGDQAMPHFILGYQYFKRQDWEDMVDQLEAFIQMDKTNAPTFANLASAHLLRFEATQDRSHLDRAIALCQEGLNSGLTMEDVTKASMWDTLGHAYTYNTPVKNYDRAMVFFQRGLTLTPNNPMIEMHMGGTYFEMGNLDMAFRFLEAAREGNQPEPYKFLAYVYARKGQMKEAVDSLTKYMALQPNDIDAAKEKRDLDNWKAQLQSQNTSQG
jgi:Tfp pilus assembly protein PilF